MLRLAVGPQGALEIAEEGPQLGSDSGLAGHLDPRVAGDARALALVVFTLGGLRDVPATGAGDPRALRAPARRAARARRGRRRGALGAARDPRQPVRARARPERARAREGHVQLDRPARVGPRRGRAAASGGGPVPDRGFVTEDLALSTSRRGLLARVGRRCSAPRAARSSRPSSRPARPRPTTSAATSTRPTRARTRPGCRASTRAACRCARRTASASTTPAGSSTARATRSTRRGRRLRDPDGNPLPPAPRTPICAAGRRALRHQHPRRRRLVPLLRRPGPQARRLLLALAQARINGDASLTGYCYKGRRVFCVMYFDTKVPC